MTHKPKTNAELDELYEQHSARYERVWEPGDTYTICGPCDTQVSQEPYGNNLCMVQELIIDIRDARAELPVPRVVDLIVNSEKLIW